TTDVAEAIAIAEPQNEPTPSKPAPAKKSIQQLVEETKAGKHGNGDARKKSLGSAYDEVQAIINGTSAPKPKPKAPAKKSVNQVAQEIATGTGGWGNGA